MSSTGIKSHISKLIKYIDSDFGSEMKLKSNGGNSIMIVCDPEQESEYIENLADQLPDDQYGIIDVGDCFLEFIKMRGEKLHNDYADFSGNPHQIYKAPEDEDSPDLFGLIIKKINSVYGTGRIPVIINVGVLYGTGISNINIIENSSVMSAKFPLILLYPGILDGSQLLFLGKKPASNYRCMIFN